MTKHLCELKHLQPRLRMRCRCEPRQAFTSCLRQSSLGLQASSASCRLLVCFWHTSWTCHLAILAEGTSAIASGSAIGAFLNPDLKNT